MNPETDFTFEDSSKSTETPRYEDRIDKRVIHDIDDELEEIGKLF